MPPLHRRNFVPVRWVPALAVAAALLLARLPWSGRLPDAWLAHDAVRFFGRTHPLVLHFPIALLVLAALLEAAALPFAARFVPAVPRRARTWLLGAAAGSAAFAAVAGWVLAQTGAHEAGLLQLHLFTGSFTAAAAMLAWALRLCAGPDEAPHRRAERGATLALFVSALLLLPAGHAGAGLTHGPDFLSRYAPRWLAPLLGETPPPAAPPAVAAPTDEENQLVFRDVIRPVLATHCLGCHGERRAKGKLRLDTRAAVLAGGDTGPAAVPGDARGSLLRQRLHLPADDEDHMPPADKDQPTAAQIALLEWWIAAGLPGDVPLSQIALPPALRPAAPPAH